MGMGHMSYVTCHMGMGLQEMPAQILATDDGTSARICISWARTLPHGIVLKKTQKLLCVNT